MKIPFLHRIRLVHLANASFCTAMLVLFDSCQTTPNPNEADISRSQAEKTALARVPGGKVKEGELEIEKGHLVWSFDITQPKTTDIREIMVDAKSGKIISEETETAQHEAEESAKEKKAKS